MAAVIQRPDRNADNFPLLPVSKTDSVRGLHQVRILSLRLELKRPAILSEYHCGSIID
jgi:hypothetical protein